MIYAILDLACDFYLFHTNPRFWHEPVISMNAKDICDFKIEAWDLEVANSFSILQLCHKSHE